MLKKLAYSIFYGNYFYGCCTVALAIEANLQQELPLSSFWFYLVLYCGTVVYYLYAYIQEREISAHANKRSIWYAENRRFIRRSLWVLTITGGITALILLVRYLPRLFRLNLIQLVWPFLIGLIALSYYGIQVGSVKLNSRKTGWFKPFAIGLVWATAVTYIPILWYEVEHNTHYIFTKINIWFFMKNFMYISLLAILFDIKDYAADHNRRLKTFVVRVGIRRTIFLVIIPLSILGFISLIIFTYSMHFHMLRITINSVPFILLLWVAWSLQRPKPIIYYLAVIDGLMLLKALCGIAAVLLVK